MIKVNTREQKSHPEWRAIQTQPIGLSLKELHEISKTDK